MSITRSSTAVVAIVFSSCELTKPSRIITSAGASATGRSRLSCVVERLVRSPQARPLDHLSLPGLGGWGQVLVGLLPPVALARYTPLEYTKACRQSWRRRR